MHTPTHQRLRGRIRTATAMSRWHTATRITPTRTTSTATTADSAAISAYAEFESKPLNREKVIADKSTAAIKLGPLKPGRYSFVEEYHENDAAAQGTIVVE